MSSTVIAKNVQIGADGTASNNFTIFQPATPDGTLRIGNGNTGITSSAVALTSAGNVGIGTSSPSYKLEVANGDASIYGVRVGRGAGAVSTNTAVGASALAANTTGANNTAFGYQSANASTTVDNITAIGYQALLNNTAAYNTAVGRSALASNTSGGENVAVGGATAFANTTGTGGTAVGYTALRFNTTGASNTAIGNAALFNNTTASNNTAVGYQAGYSGTTAADSTYLGYLAGYGVTTGTRNTLVGFYTGSAITTGTFNSFFGTQAGQAVTTGGKNTILGCYSGNQGGLDIRTASNNIVLSDGDGNPRMYFDGAGSSWNIPSRPLLVPYIYATTGAGAGTVVVGTDGNLFRSSSSARYKKEIVDARFGLSDLLNLRSVNYKGNGDQDTDKLLGGLIAEEVHDAGLTEFVIYNEQGQPDALHYANMVSLCIKAIQELNAKVDAQAAEISALKGTA